MRTAFKILIFPVYTAGLSALFLWASGDWRWTQGWIFCLVIVASFGGSTAWMHLKDPALLAERFRLPGTGGESRADLLLLLGIKAGGFAWLVLPALDHRYHWSPRMPLWCQVGGVVLLAVGGFFLFRALTDNTFASQLVRIQTERRQRVVDTGVYGMVRHPMYAGFCLMCVGSGLLLSSIAGLGAALFLIAVVVARIFGEEQVLVGGLDGYQAYRQKVRYRLVPHVW